MKNALRIGRIWGIEIGLDYSWFVIFALITWSLSAHYFPINYEWESRTTWTVGLVTSLLFFGCILAHELGHSFVALRRNLPVRSITLFIFGGLARLDREPEKPSDEFKIAIAGPIVSVGLGLVFLSLPAMTDADAPLGALGTWLGTINVYLGVFNLVPGFPLDGGRVLRSIVWHVTADYQRATRMAATAGQLLAYAFIVVGIALFFSGQVVEGLWIGFIGWFLNNAAVAHYQQATLRQDLAGMTARSVMIPDCPGVPRHLSLEELVHDHLLKSATRCFPVIEDGHTFGIVTIHNVKAYPQERWPFVTVGEAMTPLEEVKTVAPDDELFDVMRVMTESDVNQVPVLEEGQLLGMISRDRLLSFISLRTELGRATRG
jgi:Zn-dependent protease/CBS domain-containing protein